MNTHGHCATPSACTPYPSPADRACVHRRQTLQGVGDARFISILSAKAAEESEAAATAEKPHLNRRWALGGGGFSSMPFALFSQFLLHIFGAWVQHCVWHAPQRSCPAVGQCRRPHSRSAQHSPASSAASQLCPDPHPTHTYFLPPLPPRSQRHRAQQIYDFCQLEGGRFWDYSKGELEDMVASAQPLPADLAEMVGRR